MAIFGNRKRNTLDELEEYYASQKQRTGMAWAMAFLSLLVTVVILAALFFGGRLLVRTLRDNNEGQNEPTTAESRDFFRNNSENSRSDNSTDNQTPEPSETQTSPADNPTDGVVSDNAVSTSTPNTPQTSEAGQNNGSTAGVNTSNNTASSSLPNTGAGDLLIVSGIVTFTVAYIVSHKRQIN